MASGLWFPCRSGLNDPRSVSDSISSRGLANAQKLGLNAADFENCLDGGQHAGTVSADRAAGGAVGVRGTPSFFVGLTDPRDTDRVTSLTYIRGAQDYDVFKRAIEAALSSAP